MIFLKKIFQGIAISIFSVIFIMAILELSFKLACPSGFESFMKDSTKCWDDPSKSFNRTNFKPSRSLGYEFIPNAPFGTNSLGMLDKERHAKKSRDVYRIICIGDSTTAVSFYTQMLERSLNRSLSAKKFEVWNCGVPGYGIMQYCRAIENKWLAYEPDMVIIGFCLNDFKTTPLVTTKASGELVGYFPYEEMLPGINPFLFKHFASYRFIATRPFIFKDRNKEDDISEIAGTYLRGLKNLLLQKDIDFLIVILSVVEGFEKYAGNKRSSYEEIKRISREQGIPMVDTIPLFKREKRGSLRVSLKDELHFNKKGSRIVADVIYDYILNHSLKD